MNDIRTLAKIHDILKLTAEDHYCPDHIPGFVELPEEIKKALKHHCITPWGHRCEAFAVEAPFVCIKLADIKASTISRKLRVTGLKQAVNYPRRIFNIWRGDDEDGKTDDTMIALDEIFMSFRNTIDLDVLYSKYSKNFGVRAEDKRRPFSSLDTHNDLTARWASFLYRNREEYGIPETVLDRSSLRKILYSFNKKAICMVRAKLNTNYKLSRLRDAKLIKDIPALLAQFAEGSEGTAIYELPEEVLFIGRRDMRAQLADKAKELLGNRTNYYFEMVGVETGLENGKFLNQYDELFGAFMEALYPHLEETISPLNGNEASHQSIICDMCQMAPARIVYPREVHNQEDIIEEYLCEGCASLRRDKDVRASKLAKWEEMEGFSVAFCKITLDMPSLISILKSMYIETFNIKREVLEEDLGFSILKEFLSDYNAFLKEFKATALRKARIAEDRSDSILENLFCILVEEDADIKPLVDEYADIVRSDMYFRNMAEFAARHKAVFPVRLSLTISNVKFPFMEHWHFLNNPTKDINVYAAPNTRLEIDLQKYDYLRNIKLEDKKISAALHNLCEIEGKTHNPFLVTVSMLDMKNDLKELARDLITTENLQISDALAYYKIMRGHNGNSG